MGKLIVVVGGQFGSEGKGAICGYLAEGMKDLLAVRVGGPNAGHTVYGDDGTRYALRQVPVAAVTNPDARLAIAAGSEIDMPVLLDEIDLTSCVNRLVVDREATMIEDKHKAEEQDAGMSARIGSTQKGIGAARSARVMRHARRFKDVYPHGPFGDVAELANEHLQEGGTVMIEGVQGYGLGLHAGYYPRCTSIDCRAIDMLSLAGVHPGGILEVWVVLRAFPIRVAGDSGPLTAETTWEALNLPEERTTVTQKVRRVGGWDSHLARRAIEANGGRWNVKIAFTMADHWWPHVAGKTHLPISVGKELEGLEQELGAPISLVGTSPTTVVDRRHDAQKRR